MNKVAVLFLFWTKMDWGDDVMISERIYIKTIAYRQCKYIYEILKESNCTMRLESSRNIIFVNNIASLLDIENGFYHIIINGDNEKEVIKKIVNILK